MLTSQLLMSWMVGTGIAVKARQRWQSLPVGENLRFADDRGIAELRAQHPEWRAQSLAPVSIIDDVSSLPSLPDNSHDYIVGFHLLMDADRIYQSLDTVARLLRPGGTFLIPIPVSDSGPEVKAICRGLQRLETQRTGRSHISPWRRENWSCDRIAIVMGQLALLKRAMFDLEVVSACSYAQIDSELKLWRSGIDNLVVFRRKNPNGWETGYLIDIDGSLYVVDGSVIRYIPTLSILDRIRMGKPIHYVNKREFSAMVVGPPLLESDVNILIKKMVNKK